MAQLVVYHRKSTLVTAPLPTQPLVNANHQSRSQGPGGRKVMHAAMDDDDDGATIFRGPQLGRDRQISFVCDAHRGQR